MKLIVGLGNPGKEYEQTRHNAGFLVLDELAKRHGLAFKEGKALQADSAIGEMGGVRVRLLKPLTFMNLSGESVQAAMKKDAIAAKDILVVHDEADLAFGDLRTKEGGGTAGHNGIKSIKESLPKDTAFSRVRIGIGRSENPNVPLDAWVLGKWTKEESKKLPEMIAAAADRIEEWLKA